MNAFRSHVRFARWLPLFLWLCSPALRANETIRQVQEELRKRSLFFGNIDGRDTPQVTAAVRNYQKRKGFSPTGALDDTTLRSLQLLPALPPPSPSSFSSPPPAASSWPDVTVLRSDEARRAAPAAMPFPSPAAASPTPPVDIVRQPEFLEEVRAFLQAYLQAGQANDTAAEMRFYADRVDYFNEGIVDKQFIEKDVGRYDRRWPQRRFIVLDSPSLDPSPDGDPRKCVVRFRMSFANKSARFTVNGKVDVTYTLFHDGPGVFHILGMKEQRVRKT